MVHLKLAFKIFFFVGIVICGVGCVRLALSPDEYTFWMLGPYMITIGGLLLFTVSAFLLDNINFEQRRSWKQFLITAIGTGFFLVSGFVVLKKHLLEKSESVLQFSNLPNANFVGKFDFKKSESFTLTEYTMWGNSTYSGRYILRTDTIIILSSNVDTATLKIPEIGVIKNDTIFWRGYEPMQSVLVGK